MPRLGFPMNANDYTATELRFVRRQQGGSIAEPLPPTVRRISVRKDIELSHRDCILQFRADHAGACLHLVSLDMPFHFMEKFREVLEDRDGVRICFFIVYTLNSKCLCEHTLCLLVGVAPSKNDSDIHIDDGQACMIRAK